MTGIHELKFSMMVITGTDLLLMKHFQEVSCKRLVINSICDQLQWMESKLFPHD